MQRLCIALGQGIIACQLIQKTSAATAHTSLGLRLVAALWLQLGLGLGLLHGLCTGALAGSEAHRLEQWPAARCGCQEALGTCAAGRRRGGRQGIDGPGDAHIGGAIAEALRLCVIGLRASGTLERRVEHVCGALGAGHLEAWWSWTHGRRLWLLCILNAALWLRLLLLILHILWLRLRLRLWAWCGLWAWLMLLLLWTLYAL